MKEEKPKKKSKLNKLKEQLKDPKKKILFKLGGYLFFFLIIYLFLGISAALNKGTSDKKSDDNVTKVSVSFNKMKKNLINSGLNVKYKYGDYYIEGLIQDNVLSGTLEYLDGSLIKFKYDGKNIYRVNLQEEVIDFSILNGFNLNYLLPSYIINLVNDSLDSANKSSDGKIYSYNINNAAISLYLGDEAIEKIVILDNNITYSLEYSIIKQVFYEKN